MRKIENVRIISLVLDEGFDPKEANDARKLILDKGYHYGKLIGINSESRDIHSVLVASDAIFFVPRKDSRDISITSLNTLYRAQSLGREVYSKRSNQKLRYKWDCEERSIGDSFSESYKPCEVRSKKIK